MKRRLKWYTTGLVCMLILTGCSRGNVPEQNGVRIGLTLYDQYDSFISMLLDAFLEGAARKQKEAGVPVNVEVYNAGISQAMQNEQVENMIKDDCDVICVNLVDRTDPTRIIDLAEKNNIPIIFFNRELVEEDLERWDQLFYIGADAFESGVMEGGQAAEVFLADPSSDKNGDGICQYIVLEGEAGHQDSFVRTEYSVRTMQEHGIEMEKLGYSIANWNRAQAKAKMTQLLTQHGDAIELLLANNDDMAVGAIDALKEEKIPKDSWPLIFGIDGTKDGLAAIQNGEMRGTVYNDYVGQADKMMELAFRLSMGMDLKDMNLIEGKYIRLPYQMVRPADAAKYLGDQ